MQNSQRLLMSQRRGTNLVKAKQAWTKESRAWCEACLTLSLSILLKELHTMAQSLRDLQLFIRQKNTVVRVSFLRRVLFDLSRLMILRTTSMTRHTQSLLTMRHQTLAEKARSSWASLMSCKNQAARIVKKQLNDLIMLKSKRQFRFETWSLSWKMLLKRSWAINLRESKQQLFQVQKILRWRMVRQKLLLGKAGAPSLSQIKFQSTRSKMMMTFLSQTLPQSSSYRSIWIKLRRLTWTKMDQISSHLHKKSNSTRSSKKTWVSASQA